MKHQDGDNYITGSFVIYNLALMLKNVERYSLVDVSRRFHLQDRRYDE
jgi:hypothetical protein